MKDFDQQDPRVVPAFLLYAENHPLGDIAKSLDISEPDLRRLAREGNWDALISQGHATAALVAMDPKHKLKVVERAARRLERVEANRNKNALMWSLIQNKVVSLLMQAQTREGLVLKRKVVHKGQVIEYESEATVAELGTLANVISQIAAGSCAALGDTAGPKTGREAATLGIGVMENATIHVNMPDAIRGAVEGAVPGDDATVIDG